MITDPQLSEIEARAERAIEGPWFAECGDPIWEGATAGQTSRAARRYRGVYAHGKFFADCVAADVHGTPMDTLDFIASARTDVPALVAEVRRLQIDRDYWRDRSANERFANVQARARVEEARDLATHDEDGLVPSLRALVDKWDAEDAKVET